MVQDIIQVQRPWNSPDAEPIPPFLFHQEAQQLIEKCLNCPEPSCYNCLGGGKREYPEGQLYFADFFN